VASVNAQQAPSAETAEAALARLTEMSPDLQGCAILGPEARALAASGDSEGWARAGAALIGAADGAGDELASHVHVATEEGEAFAVRHKGLVMVAVAERFTLASLLIFDMRTALRDLANGGG
jgi:predicted regulator of Ras-like GTPase activity (Roadblock/LC7/MglB family)